MQSNRLGSPELPIADGQLHRFHVEGDRSGSKNGWYVLYGDGLPAGSYGSWKTGETINWGARLDRQQTAQERKAIAKLRRQAGKRRQDEQQMVWQAAATKAQTLWGASPPATDSHPYLQEKCVRAHGLRLQRSALVVPLREVSGEIQSLQFIHPDGSKRFLSNGKVVGGCFLIGDVNKVIYVVEGFATGATVHECTGEAVFVAFNCGNLKAVAVAIRLKYRNIKLVVAGDNDQFTRSNPGRAAAILAARAVGGSYIVPDFAGVDLSDKPTDFNDLARLENS
jgi:putative DNA primase/helicase